LFSDCTSSEFIDEFVKQLNRKEVDEMVLLNEDSLKKLCNKLRETFKDNEIVKGYIDDVDKWFLHLKENDYETIPD